jgi:hypothetical protein
MASNSSGPAWNGHPRLTRRTADLLANDHRPRGKPVAILDQAGDPRLHLQIVEEGNRSLALFRNGVEGREGSLKAGRGSDEGIIRHFGLRVGI